MRVCTVTDSTLCLLLLLPSCPPLPDMTSTPTAEEQGFKNMYPHQGAWGLWYLPGESVVHRHTTQAERQRQRGQL